MTKEEVRSGTVLRVVNSHGIGAPRHALATVETVGTLRSEEWLCTVRYHERRKGKRQHLYHSHLWEADLGRFEIVTDLDTVNLLPSRRGVSSAHRRRSAPCPVLLRGIARKSSAAASRPNLTDLSLILDRYLPWFRYSWGGGSNQCGLVALALLTPLLVYSLAVHTPRYIPA